MKNFLLTGFLLLAVARMSGQTPLLTVDTSGNVTANGAVSGNGLNSQGSAGGQVSISAGSDQLAPASGFSFQAPGTITSGVQVVVPNASASGIWYGVQSSLPQVTATLSGVSSGTISGFGYTSYGSNMPTAPIVVITPASGGGSCSPCAVVNAVMASSPVYPFLTLSSIHIVSNGTYTGGAPTVSFLGSPPSSPNMLNLLFEPISANTFIKGSSTTPLVPTSAIATENNSAFLPGENIDLQQNYATVIELPNYSSSGTTANQLTSIAVTGTTSYATGAAASASTGVIGICVLFCGTTGTAQIAREGVVSCSFDGSATGGDFVQASSTAGECHDTGSATYPTNGSQVLGRVLNGGSGAHSYAMMFYPVETQPVACPTCVTSSAALTGNDLVIGAGGQASQTSPLFSVNTGSAELLLGKASTTGTLGIYGSSGGPYTLSTNSAATSLTTSGNVIVGPTGTQDTLTLNTAGSAGITLSPQSSSGNTITLPAYTDTMAVIGTAQTFSAAQTFSNGVTANNLTFSGTSSHIQTNPSSGQSDIAGTATITSGTKTITVTFATSYASKPVCVVTPEADGTANFKLWYVTIAINSGHYPNLVINTDGNAGASGVVFDYICMGNPN